MSVIVVLHLIGAQQGGVCMLPMFSHPCSRDVQVTPRQVWPALPHDLRTRIAGLLAELALHMVAAHPGNACTAKEAGCAYPTTRSKNPF
ncbi:hypothetical protein KSB_45370 [Ktedonobacter robiniae]|uniref:Secreted protein n=1 Tax=Ktedonobacter robiniae TaxID=2778365 RepID=A0ABQ3UTQ6_9CHLR|nr:hypothetical protein KSB_45370 [Ktedonobacter robiniae]